MIKNEVVEAFEMLLDELERIIPDLNAQGKELLETKKYSEAHAIINTAEAVVAFQGKVRALLTEWNDIKTPARNSVISKKHERAVKRLLSSDLHKERRTHEKQFVLPILQALVDFGGNATKNQVLERLEFTMADRLNQTDWETLTSRTHEIRWKNTAAWARQRMVNDGLLARGSPIGVWEITTSGRSYLDSHRLETPSFEQVSLPKIVEGHPKVHKVAADTKSYDLSMHLLHKPLATVRLFESLRSAILSSSPDIEEIIRKVHVSYQVQGKPFTEIHIQKGAVKIWVFVPINQIQHSRAFCRDVSTIGHYGTGPTEITMTHPSQLAFVSELIQRSYKLVLGVNA